MATDNRGVMVYLSVELEIEIERYCIENNITRKNKNGTVLPSLGTGIVQYLKSNLLNTAPRTVLSPLLGAVPHSHSSTSLSDAPSNRLSTEIKAEILELIAESSTSNIPNTVLTREEVLAIAREEIDRALGSIAKRTEAVEAEIENLKMMLVKVPTSSPLAFVPSSHKSKSTIVATNPDPTNWELSPIANLVSTGISSSQIADELNLLGFTNSKGGDVSRQSVESYLSRHSDLKAIYENARKQKKIAVSSTSD
jgi:hypothetical protein